MDAPAYIEVEDVDKSFGEHQVYERLSLRIDRGAILSIVGGSGVGKSVLLRMLIGLERPDRGRLRFDGIDLTSLDEAGFLHVRRRISLLFQNGALFDSLDVGGNVAYPLHVQRELPESEVRRRVAENLERVGLPGIEEQAPASLSGGMRKRVALARAIITEPEVLLLDEPTAGLDPPTTRLIDELISRIHRELGITVVIVTHDLPTAYLVSDQIAMLAERRMVAVVSPEAFVHSKEPALAAFAHAMTPREKR
jgi:phospholipid/cholesterol/gamma-HCH transport system ATP-binding protein